MTTINYNFNPNDNVWVVSLEGGVKNAIVESVGIFVNTVNTIITTTISYNVNHIGVLNDMTQYTDVATFVDVDSALIYYKTLLL